MASTRAQVMPRAHGTESQQSVMAKALFCSFPGAVCFCFRFTVASYTNPLILPRQVAPYFRFLTDNLREVKDEGGNSDFGGGIGAGSSNNLAKVVTGSLGGGGGGGSMF